MSETHGTTATPGLVLVCGEAGVGKTTVARTIATRLGGRLIRSDLVRKELFDEPTYSNAESRETYVEALERARRTLRDGTPVVLDATFTAAGRRDRAAEVAADLGAPLRIVRVRCEKAVVRERMKTRSDDASDADFSVHLMHRDSFEPLERDHLSVDNSGPREETLAQVESVLDRLEAGVRAEP